MSEFDFQVDPIFYVPIDSEDNKKFKNKKRESYNFIKKDEYNNNKNILTFSLNKNYKNNKTMINNNKIYISQIFKNNWKFKSRRLIAKLKKRLIKQLKNYYYKKSINDKTNLIKNNFVNQIIIKSNNINNKFDFKNFFIYKDNIINKINNNNKQINNISNYNYLNNCINNCNYKKIENNNNVYTNFNFNFNQCNNNFNINNIKNSIINNNFAYNLSKNHF